MVFAAPIGWSTINYFNNGVLHWRDARWDSAGLLARDAETEEAVFQVYSARAWGKKGIVAVHSWIAYKRAGEVEFHRFDVVGWGTRHGRPAVRKNMRPIDGHWAGNPPERLADLRGIRAKEAILHAETAIQDYPHHAEYTTWPGPNSNSFVAHILRSIPQSGIELPTTAIGKDYIAGPGLFAKAPSGTGYQISLFGLFGLTLARIEGLEVAFLGFSFGIDPLRLGIKLPAVGRLSVL
jgi:hypothetical protein